MKHIFATTFASAMLASMVVVADTDSAADATDPSIEQTTVTEATVAIELSNFKNEKGQLMITVYSGEENWLTDEKVLVETLVIKDEIKDGVIRHNLTLPLGEYAVSLHHDLNSNNKIDTNFIGIPNEPIVVSNTAPARFGPPKYKDAKFVLDADGEEQTLAF